MLANGDGCHTITEAAAWVAGIGADAAATTAGPAVALSPALTALSAYSVAFVSRLPVVAIRNWSLCTCSSPPLAAAVVWPFSELLRGAADHAKSAQMIELCAAAAAHCDACLPGAVAELRRSSSRGHASIKAVLAAAPRRVLETGGWRLALTVAAAEQRIAASGGLGSEAPALQALLLSQALQAALPLASRAFPQAAAALEGAVAAALGGVDAVAALSPHWVDALRGMLAELQVRLTDEAGDGAAEKPATHPLHALPPPPTPTHAPAGRDGPVPEPVPGAPCRAVLLAAASTTRTCTDLPLLRVTTALLLAQQQPQPQPEQLPAWGPALRPGLQGGAGRRRRRCPVRPRDGCRGRGRGCAGCS